MMETKVLVLLPSFESYTPGALAPLLAGHTLIPSDRAEQWRGMSAEVGIIVDPKACDPEGLAAFRMWIREGEVFELIPGGPFSAEERDRFLAGARRRGRGRSVGASRRG